VVERVLFTSAERDMVTSLRELLSASHQWIPARLGLARSLQIAEPPSKTEFSVIAKQEHGIELHARQLTGEGADDPDDDYTDAYRALLSVYEGRDFFGDEPGFHEALQRHVRRGIKTLYEEWRASGTFANYLGQELLHDSGNAAASIASVDDLPDRIMRVAGELGIGAELETVDRGPRLTQLTLQLHTFEDLERLRRGLENIAFALGLGEDAMSLALAQGERRIMLSVPRPPSSWRTVVWSELCGALAGEEAAKMELPICLGTDVLGRPLLIDLAAAPHLLVAGTTGSGKSMCLHTILLSLLEGEFGSPELVLIDPKEVEFSAYAKSRRLRGPVRFAPEALATLEELIAEMDRRQELFRELGARDFGEAKQSGAPIERIVVVVDELGDLLLQYKMAELPLVRLAQKARFSGIHLVLATQRPEAASLPGALRSNVPSRIALTVQKSSESKIILDETGAEALLGRGDMLVRMSGYSTRRGHGCRVDHQDIQAGVALA
jgi:S-DNA-T family DNA segregation ATPase FtsK/SpoIIIE